MFRFHTFIKRDIVIIPDSSGTLDNITCLKLQMLS